MAKYSLQSFCTWVLGCFSWLTSNSVWPASLLPKQLILLILIPLSTRNFSGQPGQEVIWSRTFIILVDGRLVSISIFNTALLKSSMTLKVLNRCPLINVSLIKSIDPQPFACAGIANGSGFLDGRRFFPFLQKLSFYQQYTRCPLLWFHLCPWRLIIWNSLSNP